MRLDDTDRIFLLTLPRIAGYVFNPVSFYFCTRSTGEPICAVAEVGNTFGELKPYLVPLDSGATDGGVFRLVAPKHYYVSPFSPVDLEFHFRFHLPDARLRVFIDDYDAEGKILVSTLTGRRGPPVGAALPAGHSQGHHRHPLARAPALAQAGPLACQVRASGPAARGLPAACLHRTGVVQLPLDPAGSRHACPGGFGGWSNPRVVVPANRPTFGSIFT